MVDFRLALGALAVRAPAAVPVPPLDALFLPPPAPPPQGLPPVAGNVAVEATVTAKDTPTAVGGVYSIQTVPNAAADPAAAAAAAAAADNVVEITTTPPAPVSTDASTGTDTDTKGDQPGGAKGPHNEPQPGDCRLMGPFAIFVQLGLGGMALLSLVFKRWRERPQRPVKIWFFDASKQVFGSVLVHVANVFMSLLTSGRFNMALAAHDVGAAGAVDEPYVPNPCSFYLLNLAIDTTLGIPILILLLHATTALVAYTPLGQPPESIRSGNYGCPPNAWWWLKQSIMYFCGLFGMKLCVLIIFLTMPWISRVGDWALGWTDGNEELQIFFVMMLFPLIMNAMQYYIIDSFIKGDSATPHPRDLDDEHRTTAYDQLADSADSADDEGSDDGGLGDSTYLDSSTSFGASANTNASTNASTRPADVMAAKRSASGLPAPALAGKKGSSDPEYDPELDGDSSTIIGSSSSQRSRQDGRKATVSSSVPKDLYPAE